MQLKFQSAWKMAESNGIGKIDVTIRWSALGTGGMLADQIESVISGYVIWEKRNG